MVERLWNAGDKVRLTGDLWDDGELGLRRGEVVTLEKAFTPGCWIIVEGDRAANGAPVKVWQNPRDEFAAELVEDEVVEFTANGGEVRSVSSTGGEKGVKPEAYALIPWDAMDEVARVYNAGAEKYAAHNWRRGYEWSKSFSAACRHLFAFWKGEEIDPELGTRHLAMAIFHLLGMLAFSMDKERYGGFDDRYKPEAPADSDR